MKLDKKEILKKLEEKKEAALKLIKTEVSKNLVTEGKLSEAIYFIFNKKEEEVIDGPFNSKVEASKKINGNKDLIIISDKQAEKLMKEEEPEADEKEDDEKEDDEKEDDEEEMGEDFTVVVEKAETFLTEGQKSKYEKAMAKARVILAGMSPVKLVEEHRDALVVFSDLLKRKEADV